MDDRSDHGLLEELEGLERTGWESLCNGTAADYFEQLMTPSSRMILLDGRVMTREEVVAALRDSPTWDGYELDEVTLVRAGAEAAALVYWGTAYRGGSGPMIAAMSTLYVREHDRWRLALYTQTPVPR